MDTLKLNNAIKIVISFIKLFKTLVFSTKLKKLKKNQIDFLNNDFLLITLFCANCASRYRFETIEI
jgi:hypothetical protein